MDTKCVIGPAIQYYSDEFIREYSWPQHFLLPGTRVCCGENEMGIIIGCDTTKQTYLVCFGNARLARYEERTCDVLADLNLLENEMYFRAIVVNSCLYMMAVQRDCERDVPMGSLRRVD